jgi:tetratricopeptide (TPR) repeat protein
MPGLKRTKSSLLPHIDRPAAARDDSWNRAERVPVWLVALVVALLLAVVGTGAYVLVTRIVGDAERVPEAALVQPDGRPVSQLTQAYTLQQAGEYGEAVRAYEGVLGQEPDNLAALYNKGVCLLQLDRDAQAEGSLRRVLKLAPEHALAAVALGEYYAREERFDDLLAAVTPAAAAHEQMADLQALRGLGLEKTGKVREAAEAYRTALRFAPDLERAQKGLARLGASAQ